MYPEIVRKFTVYPEKVVYKPTIIRGKLNCGENVIFGTNVVINVDEEVNIGNRAVIPDNAYFEGRRITIGDDFYGYTWDNRRLDIGRGRIDEEYAVLSIGDRCTMHDNRIDLSRDVWIGNDVGLSPEVIIYTHGYWMSPLEGYPVSYQRVDIYDKVIIGYRTTILPGASIGAGCVVGANSLVPRGILESRCIYAGNPVKMIRKIDSNKDTESREYILKQILSKYVNSCTYRKFDVHLSTEYPVIKLNNVCLLNVEKLTVEGVEDAYSDDLRDFLFKHGIRLYTHRPFHKIGKKRQG